MRFRMKESWTKVLISLVVLFIVVLLLYHYFDDSSSEANALIGVFVAIAFLFTFLTYFSAKKVERFKFGNEKRHEFITNKVLAEIRSRIEHNDIKLMAVLAATNMPNQYTVKYQHNEEEEKGLHNLHEQFDNYLNWIEGVAILWNNGLIEEGDLKGLWQYYTNRLIEAEIDEQSLRDYLENTWHYNGKGIDEFIKQRQESTQWMENGEKKPFYDPTKEGKSINPITHPVWFYINIPMYEFDTLIEFIEHCYLLP